MAYEVTYDANQEEVENNKQFTEIYTEVYEEWQLPKVVNTIVNDYGGLLYQ